MSEPVDAEISVVRPVRERGVNFAAGEYSLVFLLVIKALIDTPVPGSQQSGLGTLWRKWLGWSAEEWVFTALRDAFAAEPSTATIQSEALRVPPDELSQYSTPRRDMFALTRSHDRTRGGMQLGRDAFSFAHEGLAGFAFGMPVADGTYTLSVLFTPPSAELPLRRATLVIPLPPSVDTSLALLTFAIQLAGFFETPLEYADHGGGQSQRVKN